VASLRDSRLTAGFPGTYVPGFHISPLRGWGAEHLGLLPDVGRLGSLQGNPHSNILGDGFAGFFRASTLVAAYVYRRH
jgi:hypothetical protein